MQQRLSIFLSKPARSLDARVDLDYAVRRIQAVDFGFNGRLAFLTLPIDYFYTYKVKSGQWDKKKLGIAAGNIYKKQYFWYHIRLTK